MLTSRSLKMVGKDLYYPLYLDLDPSVNSLSPFFLVRDQYDCSILEFTSFLILISTPSVSKVKVTFGQKLRYKIKVTFGEISLKLCQTKWNVAINNVSVVC
jgi:hypothetical protein